MDDEARLFVEIFTSVRGLSACGERAEEKFDRPVDAAATQPLGFGYRTQAGVFEVRGLQLHVKSLLGGAVGSDGPTMQRIEFVGAREQCRQLLRLEASLAGYGWRVRETSGAGVAVDWVAQAGARWPLAKEFGVDVDGLYASIGDADLRKEVDSLIDPFAPLSLDLSELSELDIVQGRHRPCLRILLYSVSPAARIVGLLALRDSGGVDLEDEPIARAIGMDSTVVQLTHRGCTVPTTGVLAYKDSGFGFATVRDAREWSVDRLFQR